MKKQPIEPAEPVMINPEDGLHQTFAELQEKMGTKAFLEMLEMLEKATPPGEKSERP